MSTLEHLVHIWKARWSRHPIGPTATLFVILGFPPTARGVDFYFPVPEGYDWRISQGRIDSPGCAYRHDGSLQFAYDISLPGDADCNIDILAAAAGVVVQPLERSFAPSCDDNSGNGQWGNTVVIDHGGGFFSRVAHLNEVYVDVGNEVCRGQVLGTLGSTGESTAPHVHFQVQESASGVSVPFEFVDNPGLLSCGPVYHSGNSLDCGAQCIGTIPGTGQAFRVTDSGGQTLMAIFHDGNIGLRGQLVEQSSATPPAGSFIIQASDGSRLGWVDRTSGDLQIGGSLHCTDSPLYASPVEAEFYVENSSGNIVAKFNGNSKDLFIRGKLEEHKY